jgi:hypothetical protein
MQLEDRAARFGVDPFKGQALQIWQGTILEGGGGLIPKRKLVISADCDLANDKGGGEFFALDILRAEEFARQLLVSDGRGELISVLLKDVRDTAKGRNAAFADVTDEVLTEWLTESPESRWTYDLPSLHANERDWLRAIRAAIARLASMQADNGGSCAPTLLIECANAQLAKQVDQLNKRLKQTLQKRIEPSRVDLYILPPLPGDTNTVGHVVPFKSLTLMSRGQVCLKRIDLIEQPMGYLPRATCRPVLLQSLLQKMTTYFARVGLTNSFKSEQEAVVKTLVESMR